MSTRAPGSRATCHLTYFSETLPPPPRFFSVFTKEIASKIGKMYEALTAMVFNQLLWGFAHIFLHPLFMSAASISQFDWQLVNQQRQIYDSVFRLFDSSKYLTTLRSNISPCQKATTLILIPLYNPSFHLWKLSKNIWALSRDDSSRLLLICLVR